MIVTLADEVPRVFDLHGIRAVWPSRDHDRCVSLKIVADNAESIVIMKISVPNVFEGERTIVGVSSSQLILHSVYIRSQILSTSNVSISPLWVAMKADVVGTASFVSEITLSNKP